MNRGLLDIAMWITSRIRIFWSADRFFQNSFFMKSENLFGHFLFHLQTCKFITRLKFLISFSSRIIQGKGCVDLSESIWFKIYIFLPFQLQKVILAQALQAQTLNTHCRILHGLQHPAPLRPTGTFFFTNLFDGASTRKRSLFWLVAVELWIRFTRKSISLSCLFSVSIQRTPKF